MSTTFILDNLEPAEVTELPSSVYDVKLASCDETVEDILGPLRNKVTLLFNVAAGCGNIPQHHSLQLLHERYADNPDFNILAVVVDDFVCHGYPEFQNGLQSYIDQNNLTLKPGELARDYAVENFKVSYPFSQLTAGRYDKHTYSPDYVPGQKLQEQHPLWNLLTGAWEADTDENGVPYHLEEIPWSVGRVPHPEGVKGHVPLTGNFDKFLISRDGRKVRRYANGFLLGERDWFGNTFPWIEERYQDNGLRDYRPNQLTSESDAAEGSWPTAIQRKGIDLSIELLSADIDKFLYKP
jgi:glutathione peroxidase-family protein